MATCSCNDTGYKENNMFSPRRLQFDNMLLERHGLSSAPPPADSLFWRLWQPCLPIAQKTLVTPYINGIKNANLDPVIYGGFNVSDAYYCFNGAQSYLAAESRTDDEGLKFFLLEKYKRYQTYNEAFPTIWHVRDASGVVPTPACRDYAQFESDTASHADPIYTLIMMIPCEYLWYWLANQLMPPSPSNLYGPWITANDSTSGAYAMGNFLDQYQRVHPGAIDENKAQSIYSTAMNFEWQNFLSATQS
ncbi:hypothetical protein D3C77_386970 [compost metagenome]